MRTTKSKKSVNLSLTLFLVNCLIPNLEKFNEVEDKIITNFLPTFCFKDAAHKIQQQENLERIEKETFIQADLPSTSTQPNIYQHSNNLQNPSNNNDFLQRKKTRGGSRTATRGTASNKKKDRVEDTDANTPAHEIKNSGETVGVKLICDTPNDDLRRYFSKTVNIH